MSLGENLKKSDTNYGTSFEIVFVVFRLYTNEFKRNNEKREITQINVIRVVLVSYLTVCMGSWPSENTP